MGHLLVINSGSSSLKYAVFRRTGEPVTADDRTAAGIIEPIGEAHARHRRTTGDASTPDVVDAHDLAAALTAMQTAVETELTQHEPVTAVAHRVVHGADRYTEAVVVDETVEAEIEGLAALAPLHNPANLAAIRSARTTFGGVPQVAVFDTAFHSSLPEASFRYAVPPDLVTDHQVRRWGFQGINCAHVCRAAADHLGRPRDMIQLVICHLGSGASLTAVRDGRSLDTSMGMTPLEGLVMSTRSGDIDAAVVPYLMDVASLDASGVLELLTHQSGLLGLSGDSDLRAVRRRAGAGDRRAAVALDVYTHRIRRYLGGYLAELPQLDALVFTAGVGEHDAATRADVVGPLAHLGLALDAKRNAAAIGGHAVTSIGAVPDGPAILVVPADEELEIARQTQELLGG